MHGPDLLKQLDILAEHDDMFARLVTPPNPRATIKAYSSVLFD